MTQEPIYYTDAQFGRLELDQALNWLSCEATWLGAPVLLYASMDDAESEDSVLSVARALWKDAAAWDARIREFAADRLLELKNDSWLEEGESEVTRAEFIRRMKLETITVSPEGDFDFMHHDDGMFRGHSIQVTGSLEEGPTDADIPG